MANTRFQHKRSSVSGVVPTTSDIASGELGINLADGRLFTSNGTAVFELGANLTSLAVGNTTVRQTVNSTGVFVNGGVTVTGTANISGNTTIGGLLNATANVNITSNNSLFTVASNTTFGVDLARVNLVARGTTTGETATTTAFLGPVFNQIINYANLTSGYSRVYAVDGIQEATFNAETTSNGTLLTGAVFGLDFNSDNFSGVRSTINAVANSTTSRLTFALSSTTAQTAINHNLITTGNTTVNAQLSSANVVIANATSRTTVGLADIRIGNTATNVVIANTTSSFGGNVSITGVANVTGNVTLGSSAFFVGNGNFITTVNATNITTGTLPDARLSAAVVNTTGTFTLTGIRTHQSNLVMGNTTVNTQHSNATILISNSTSTTTLGLTDLRIGNTATNVIIANTTSSFGGNVVITGTANVAANLTIGASGELIISNGAGIQANGTFGTAGQVLSSNGTGVYWATASGGGRIDPRVSSTASASSVTPDISNFDMYIFTALATNLTINATTSGSPLNGNKLTFRFKDNGTSRSLTWTTAGTNSFRAIGVTLPTSTTINKVTYVGCIYNADESFWDVVAVLTQA